MAQLRVRSHGFLGRNAASYPGGNRDAWHEADFKWDGKHELGHSDQGRMWDSCVRTALLNRELAHTHSPYKV